MLSGSFAVQNLIKIEPNRERLDKKTGKPPVSGYQSIKFILPQRYKNKTQAGNSERPHGHLSQPHPKQQLKFT